MKLDDNLFIEEETKGNFNRIIKADIILIQYKDYTVLIVTQTKDIIAHTDFDDVLNQFKNDLRFLQIHQSYLINLNYITNLSRML